MEIHEVPVDPCCAACQAAKDIYSIVYHTSWNHKSRQQAAPGVAWQATRMSYHEDRRESSWIYHIYTL